VGVAFEAFSHGIPSIALSLQTALSDQHNSDYALQDWSVCQRVAAFWAAKVLAGGLPPSLAVLNLNIPLGATIDTEVRLTRQSRLSSSRFLRPAPRSWSSGFQLGSEPEPNLHFAEPGSDIRALYFDKVVSLTPLGWDLSQKEVLL
jgi:5'-nucleotidase